jgi:hypothetical protein
MRVGLRRLGAGDRTDQIRRERGRPGIAMGLRERFTSR